MALEHICEAFGVEMKGFDGVIANGTEPDVEDDVLTIESDMEH